MVLPVKAATSLVLEASLQIQSPFGLLIDRAPVPGGGELYLYRRGEDYQILSGEEQLMGSWAHHSERALASIVARRMGARAQHILVGGLGMGFTLASARESFPPSATIVVAELVPGIVEWARGHLAHLFDGSLDDPRVSIQIQDVHDTIVEQPDSFDAILLDVDNGPDGLVSLANERLYCDWGLRAAHIALRPGGILAIWSSFSDELFSQRLCAAGFDVESRWIATGGGDEEAPHLIWLAIRRD